MFARPATVRDATAMAQIYNQAIEDGHSTFETRLRTTVEVHAWFDGKHPIVAVEHDSRVIAYAATFDYSSRDCYRGIAEFAVYVDRGERARGAGKLALAALFVAARSAGYWKLVSRIFPENSNVRKVGSSRVDLQACKLEYSIVSPK